jgi:hypothetical protein
MQTAIRVLILGFCVMLTSCAGMQRDWIAANCSKDGAYASGMNDGRDAKKMSIDAITQMCPVERIPEATQSYREGYQAAMQSNQQPTGTANYGTIINVGGLGSPDPAYQNQKAWFCDVEAFGEHFEAFGPTQLEAKQRSQLACTRKNNKMHCEDAACRRNQ